MAYPTGANTQVRQKPDSGFSGCQFPDVLPRLLGDPSCVGVCRKAGEVDTQSGLTGRGGADASPSQSEAPRHSGRQAFASVCIDDIEDPESLAIVGAVLHDNSRRVWRTPAVIEQSNHH